MVQCDITCVCIPEKTWRGEPLTMDIGAFWLNHICITSLVFWGPYSQSSGHRKGFIPKYQGVLCKDTPHRCYSLGKLQLDSIRATAWRCLIKSLLFCKYHLSPKSQGPSQQCWDVARYKMLPSSKQAEVWADQISDWFPFLGPFVAVTKLVAERWLGIAQTHQQRPTSSW